MTMLTSEQRWIPAETVAEAMLELLTRTEYVGGTILEVSGCGTRVVKMIGVRTISIHVVLCCGMERGYGRECEERL